jgi:hypothetical protein
VTKSTLIIPAFGGHVDKQELGLQLSAQHLDDGEYVVSPRTECGNVASWTTRGTGLFSGDEKGFVTYDVHVFQSKAVCIFGHSLGQVTASFSNPSSGSNTCSASTTVPGDVATCNITSGNRADANFFLSKVGHAPPGTASTFTAAHKPPAQVLQPFGQCLHDLPNVKLFQQCLRGG